MDSTAMLVAVSESTPKPPGPPVRWIVGCMTGTSLDGLDVALVRIVGHALNVQPHFVGLLSRPLGDLARVLRQLARGQAHEPIVYMRAARRLGELHAQGVADLCREHLPSDSKLNFVVAHGQTIWHEPDEHLSWQLFDPQPLAAKLQVPVCYDLRQADLIAGGQGAPITPLADWLMYHNCADVVVNLGGICNITSLAGAIDGFDLCPCNLLIDQVVRYFHSQMDFDRDGALAAAGKAESAIFKPMFEGLPFLQKRRRSLGREDFTDQTIAALIKPWQGSRSQEDVIASAVESVAEMVGKAASSLGGGRVILAGGGANNCVLVQRIKHYCGACTSVCLSDEVGIPVAAREAMGFAVLGALCEDRVPITLEQATGAKRVGGPGGPGGPGVAGVWVYP